MPWPPVGAGEVVPKFEIKTNSVAVPRASVLAFPGILPAVPDLANQPAI